MTRKKVNNLLNSSVHPIHFEEFDGHQFERLVFAYLLRTHKWQSLEWYGQTGGDSGRDIWGVSVLDGYPNLKTICVQCINQRTVSFQKIKDDFEKILKSPNGRPDKFMIVAGCNVSPNMRDKTKLLCESKQVYECEIWSGSEFEENLRYKGESLLKRFVTGEEFPDLPADIQLYVQTATNCVSDNEILALMAILFDRPAFYTPFHQESSIPAFKQAITDTVEALNTGIRRLRDGTEICRIPSRHDIQSSISRETLVQVEHKLVGLRAKYDEFIRNGEIRPCDCNLSDCTVFFISPDAAREMDNVRMQILELFRSIYPPFKVGVGLD